MDHLADENDRSQYTLRSIQELIERMYGEKDRQRGVEGTFMWLMEEVGELAAALRENQPLELAREFADVLAWLVTTANIAGVDLQQAFAQKYGDGCPGCGKVVCQCELQQKP